MKGLIRIAKWISGIVAIALLLFLINLAAYRLRGASDAQEAALAQMAQESARPAAADNAYALAWLMRYDVPDGEIESITAADAREAEALIASGKTLAGFNQDQRNRLPEPAKDEPGLCASRDEACLSRVAEDSQATRAALARYSRSLERMRLLETKRSFRSLLPETVSTPIPHLGEVQRLRLSELALIWSDGGHAAAMAGICRNVASWRVLGSHSDSLIFTMLSMTYADDAIRLFSDMLSAWPADQLLPSECGSAFSPVVVDDVSLCSQMRSEWRLSDAVISQIERDGFVRTGEDETRSFTDALFPLLFSRQQSQAWRAEEIEAGWCVPDDLQNALQDHPIGGVKTSPALLECASNVVGCILHGIASPAYVEYSQRQLDAAAHLRLAATLIWLRETRDDPRPLVERFASRPAHLRSGTRASGISEDGRSIWVDNLHARRSARFSLALPVAVGE